MSTDPAHPSTPDQPAEVASARPGGGGQTHRTRLARQLVARTGLGYQQALSRVVAAAEAGRLPRKLDAAGRRRALDILTAAERGGSSEPPQAPERPHPTEDAAGHDPSLHLHTLLDRCFVRGAATDVHLEPGPETVMIRQRVDGTLSAVADVSPEQGQALLAQVRIRAGLRVDNHTRPDDGTFRLATATGIVRTIRVATIPTAHGTSCVLRLNRPATPALGSLGYDTTTEQGYRAALGGDGLILLTGATGSGKSAAMYAALNAEIRSGRTVVTIEDPIEHVLPGAFQITTDPDAGITVAAAARHATQLGAHVIAFGELRDAESLELAVTLAHSGHLVLATAHASSSIAAAQRLARMTGHDEATVAAALTLVVHQRLVQRLCPQCRVPRPATAEEQQAAQAALSEAALSGAVATVWDANPGGCDACHAGERGRVPVAEVLVVDPEARAAVRAGVPLTEALTRGLRQTSKSSAWARVVAGEISPARLAS